MSSICFLDNPKNGADTRPRPRPLFPMPRPLSPRFSLARGRARGTRVAGRPRCSTERRGESRITRPRREDNGWGGRKDNGRGDVNGCAGKEISNRSQRGFGVRVPRVFRSPSPYCQFGKPYWGPFHVKRALPIASHPPTPMLSRLPTGGEDCQQGARIANRERGLPTGGEIVARATIVCATTHTVRRIVVLAYCAIGCRVVS